MTLFLALRDGVATSRTRRDLDRVGRNAARHFGSFCFSGAPCALSRALLVVGIGVLLPAVGRDELEQAADLAVVHRSVADE